MYLSETNTFVMRSSFILFIFLLVFSCSSNINQNENCRFLLNVGVNLPIDLNLPKYSQLQFAGNSVYEPNYGNAGVIIAYTGVDYLAWDAADPNHPIQSCSVLKNSGLIAVCGCDDKNEYNLVNGLPMNNTELQCSLKFYRVEKSGNMLLITN